MQNVEVMEEIQQLDNKDYMDELNLYKDVLYKNSCNNFKIIMWEKIPYWEYSNTGNQSETDY